jgi:hypothetical protein
MRWRDIRFEKPTEADADSFGRVLILYKGGYFGLVNYKSAAASIAWMPLSELPAFDRIPDPPEGWRFVQAGEAFDKRAKHWDETDSTWNLTSTDFWAVRNTYIVPIDPPKPPEPQYRPFADAAEFEPYSTKLWRFTDDAKDTRRQSLDFNDRVCGGITWERCLANKVFADGSPFGVRVEK